jgi:uncharacterized protein
MNKGINFILFTSAQFYSMACHPERRISDPNHRLFIILSSNPVYKSFQNFCSLANRLFNMTAQYYIEHLELQPHPEGGFYKETYRSKGKIAADCLPRDIERDRSYSTAIYFLLQQGDFSAFHRIRSDECWHFYDGGTVLVHVLHQSGEYSCTRVGKNIHEGEVFQYLVPAGAWFASEPASFFSLVGCTVAPGFDFADFEMAKKNELVKQFPQHENLIARLCR